MILNNIKIALRSLIQNKIYSIVNITGLAIALSVVLLIMVYVKDDLSFDRFHKNGNQIFRLVADVHDPNTGEVFKTGNTGHIQGPIFKDQIPEIETFCRFKNGWNTLVKNGNDAFEEELIYADSTVFTMFSFEFLIGNPKTALDKSNNIVITQPMAQKYFGSIDVLGKLLYVADEAGAMKPFEVSAVIKKLPSNSTIQFDLLCSFRNMLIGDTQYTSNETSWFNSSLNTFLMLRSDADIKHTHDKIQKITQTHVDEEFANSDDKEAKKSQIIYKLQPFFDVHLDPVYFATNGMQHWSDVKYPKILSGIALLLILIASINFINLSLARSVQRNKEIGIRKTLGSTRSQMFLQFLNESTFTTLIAAIPAFVLAYSLLPAFSALTEKYLSEHVLFTKENLLLYILLVFIISLIAGGYPAYVMSGFEAIKSIKGKTLLGTKNYVRQSLVIFQFTLAGILMTGTVFLTLQFRYINTKPLGYETADRYRFWLPWGKISEIGSIVKSELSKLSDIELVSSKSGDYNRTKFKVDSQDTDWTYYEHIDENHLQLMNIPLVSGRYFSGKYALDTVSNIIVNESFVRENIPKNIDPHQYSLIGSQTTYNIIGVVKDFHYAAFNEKIEPMVFFLDKGRQAGLIHVKIKKGRDKEALAAIQTIYKKYEPLLPLEYQSLEEFRMESYAQELREKKIVTYMSILVIIIACLGLFGLATFMTERRTKEIGIRKVMGAGVTGIAILLSKEFIKLVIISIIIAIPLGYYFVNQWLENFTYRIEIKWWYFVFVALVAILIAFITVFYQSVSAATADPVKSLKAE